MDGRAMKVDEMQRRKLRPLERSLMLIALGLDPRYEYADYELQLAWRRRIAAVRPDGDENQLVAAAVNASYLSLISSVEIPIPVDLSL